MVPWCWHLVQWWIYITLPPPSSYKSVPLYRLCDNFFLKLNIFFFSLKNVLLLDLLIISFILPFIVLLLHSSWFSSVFYFINSSISSQILFYSFRLNIPTLFHLHTAFFFLISDLREIFKFYAPPLPFFLCWLYYPWIFACIKSVISI